MQHVRGVIRKGKQMIRKITRLLLCLGLWGGFAVMGGESEPAPKIMVWPRSEPVNIPTDLEQFMYWEIPAPPEGATLELRLTLPEGMEIRNFPKGTGPVLPVKSRSIFPKTFSQKENLAVLTFAPADRSQWPHRFLSMTVAVKTPPGDYRIRAERIINGKPESPQEIPLRVYPALSGSQPEKMTLAAYDYPGYEPEFLSTYLEMNRRAGINALYHMRGEPPRTVTASDLAPKYGIRNGLIFFVHQVQDYFKGRELPEAARGVEVASLTALLDHPEAMKAMLKEFFTASMDGKDYSCIIYDAERGAFFGGRPGGDRTPYGLAQFRKYAGIPADEALTDQELSGKYRKQWVDWNCDLTVRVSRLVREVLDESFPDFRYEVYSGYEVDEGPHKDRTRELYGVDWKKLADTGFDYATAGYFGSMDQLRNTAAAVRGKASYIPAEMYVENFNHKGVVRRDPGAWSVHLLRAILNSDRQGITLWYANVMDGNALIAVDRVASLLCRTEDFWLRGTPDPEAVTVRPEAEREQVHVLRLGGNALVLLLNSADFDKTLRLTLNGFRVRGYTGELGITDVMSGEKIKPAGILRVTVPARSFRTIQIFDDGN